MRKIAGEFNPADLYTKHLESKAKIEQLVSLFGGEFREGRAESAPQLREDRGAVQLSRSLSRDDGPAGHILVLVPEIGGSRFGSCFIFSLTKETNVVFRVPCSVFRVPCSVFCSISFCKRRLNSTTGLDWTLLPSV